ncbi:MAG: EF-hand domain-containing protein [bacterium]|nr:EF-hand domain-containing protein [bacterium]
MISSIGASGVNPAYGQRPPGPPKPEEVFQRLDGDGNGALETSELQVMAEKHAEMTGEQMSVEDLLDRFDADGNGTLEVGEMPAKGPQEFRGPPPFLAEDGSVAGSPETTAGFATLDALLTYLGNDDSGEESVSLLDLQA